MQLAQVRPLRSKFWQKSFPALACQVLSDVKGDLSGLAKAGSESHKLHAAFTKRAAAIGLQDFTYEQFPCVFWDIFGKDGHPVRTTVSEMGPLLLSQLLELTETQEGILNIAFRLADEQ